MDHDPSRHQTDPEDPDDRAAGAPESDWDRDGLDRQDHGDRSVHGGGGPRDPLRGFVVVRQFGARWGSDVAGSAFGTAEGPRPGPLKRFLALVLLVLLVVPVLILFVLIAVVALVLGIVLSMVAAVVRPFRAPTSPVAYAPQRDPGPREPAPQGPITDDAEGRHNVRVVDRR